MIVPDVNLLVYAYHENDPNHVAAKFWWEGLVNGVETIGMPWAVSMGFVRIMLNPKVLSTPMSQSEAIEYVERWFEHDHINPIDPGIKHLALFQQILNASGGSPNLVPDAHIAALALERQAIVHSNDSDFSRFPGLQWHNPLQSGLMK
ncbi:MAG: PIN domain-containing protein [Caldilineaceae bacterium]|nr:PIN domain-containing protein [Caldilineaceae bacterium]